ncbi:glycine-rich domain-containing protein [Streptosporangium sp. NPDC002607]
MTITADRPINTRPLITPELFDRLTARIKADHPAHADRAEQIMEQALSFLVACGARPSARLAPSAIVDIGWHTFLMYTREYAEFCQRVASRFIHHAPDAPDISVPSGSNAAATTTVMRELGLPVISDLWAHPAACSGSGTGKCSQCHQGCTDSN